MAKATSADVVASHLEKIDAAETVAGGTGSNTLEATLRSKNDWGYAVSQATDVAWGDTKDVVYGAALYSKMLWVASAVGAWIGNRRGVMAAEMNKPRGFLGVA